MSYRCKSNSIAAVLLICCGLASAGELGDPAAEIQASKWLRGEKASIAQTRGKNVFVVEFWATWCGPCTASIPHLTAIQKKYQDKGLVVVGLTVPDPRQNAQKIESFVTEKGDQMGYTVAIDDGGKTWQAYMGAFKLDKIPTAFVVDRQGNVVWYDNPADPGSKLDEVIERVVSDKFDAAAARELKADTQIERMTGEIAEAAAQRYFNFVSTGGDARRARKLADVFIALMDHNPGYLANFARTIVVNPTLKTRDMDLALELVSKANEMTGGKDIGIADLYARALFESGKFDQAVAQGKIALALAMDEPTRKALQENLDSYTRNTAAPALVPPALP